MGANNRSKWSSQDDERLREIYPDYEIPDIASELERTISSVLNRAAKLGLKRNKKFSERNRFKKGLVPWNKGLRVEPVGGTLRTLFKKGDAPKNKVPIGSETVKKGGVLYRKISETGVRRNDWRSVHTLIWEEKYGPIDDGMIVRFKDGNKRNFDIENLIAVTRAEHVKMNSIQRYGEEYHSLSMKLGWFKKKIKELENEKRK